MIIGSPPLAPLNISPVGKAAPNPRLANDIAQTSAYLPLCALVFTEIRFSKNDLGLSSGGGKLPAVESLTGLIASKNFDTVDLLAFFARTGGPNEELDVEARTSGNFDPQCDLLEGRAKDPTKVDWIHRYCQGAQKHTHLISITNSRGDWSGVTQIGSLRSQ